MKGFLFALAIWCLLVALASSDSDEGGLPPLNHTGKCRDYDRLCQECEGDCDNDEHCAEGLACFIRNSRTYSARLPVPGCAGNPSELYAKDFCYNATLEPCQDISGPFSGRRGRSRDCDWVGRRPDRRCEPHGHNCRFTCGYCRTREPSSMPSGAPSLSSFPSAVPSVR